MNISRNNKSVHIMIKSFYIIGGIFAVSTNSFRMFPISRRFGCRAIYPTGKVCEVDNEYIYGHPNKRHLFAAGSDKLSSISSESIRSFAKFDEGDSFHSSVLAYLFRHGKTWKRLSHLLDLAIENKDKVNGKKKILSSEKKSVADIGTDHGLLAIGLALTENYKTVVGVDISDQALSNGALILLDKIRNRTATLDDDDSGRFPVEFRVGNGLEALKFGEADTICIAGMGVNKMLQILEQDCFMSTRELILEKIGCQRLVLQPTNSRPRNLILLYDRLQKLGWKVKDERIEKISSRWYITTCFEIPTDPASSSDRKNESVEVALLDLPGLKLESCGNSSLTRKTFDEYCLHHRQWITQDSEGSSRQTDPRDIRWLDYFDKQV